MRSEWQAASAGNKRVLLHRADGWLALPYVWNEEQTEAVLKVAGKRIPDHLHRPVGQGAEHQLCRAKQEPVQGMPLA